MQYSIDRLKEDLPPVKVNLGEPWGIKECPVAGRKKKFPSILLPFDMYQGPYVVIGVDVTIGVAPYAMPLHLPGIIRLWIGENDQGNFVYREDIDQIALFWNEDDILDAAEYLLRL